jgi:hypothetical protein
MNWRKALEEREHNNIEKIMVRLDDDVKAWVRDQLTKYKVSGSELVNLILRSEMLDVKNYKDGK